MIIVSITFLFALLSLGFIRYAAPRIFEHYRKQLQERTTKITGAKAARFMLKHAGIEGVTVSVYPFQGEVEQICYNKDVRSVFLSHEVYHSKNIVAVAIACHEAAHAIQHARGKLNARKGFNQLNYFIEREANKLTFEWMESDLARSIGGLQHWAKDARKLLRWSLLTYAF